MNHDDLHPLPLEPTLRLDEAEAEDEDEEEQQEDEEKEVGAREVEAAVRPGRSDDGPVSFLGRYFREIARLPLLRPEQEVELATRLEERESLTWERLLEEPTRVADVMKAWRAAIGSPVPGAMRLTRVRTAAGLQRVAHEVAPLVRSADLDKVGLTAVLDEVVPRGPRPWARHVKNAAARARRAKDHFVRANLRLVVVIARRYDHGHLPLPDLIQEGNLGLIKAVDRFDHRRGNRFSTYATWWIRHAIQRALADKGRMVRVPVHLLDSQHRIARSTRELMGRLGRAPTSEELSVATGLPPRKLEKATDHLPTRPISLDSPLGDDDSDRHLGDVFQDPHADIHSPADDLGDRAIADEVRAQLEHLKPIEMDILRQRFGLDDDQERTLKQIGEKYNLSRERIRQLQEQALAKMRQALKRRGLTA